MSLTKVFISGAAEELEPEKEIAWRCVKSLYMEPVVNNALLSRSDTGASGFIDEVKDADLFVLLLWKRLMPEVEIEYQAAVENRKPLIICVKMLKGNESRDEKLINLLSSVRDDHESDFPGGQIDSYQDFRSLADLEKTLEDAITKEIRRQLKHSVITAGTRQEMYMLGARIASAARQRLYAVQKSGILILGAREYNAPQNQKVWYEMEYLNSLNNWIGTCINDPSRRCAYLYEVEGTRKEIEKYNLQDVARSNLMRYKDKEKESGYRFQLASMTTKHPPGPMTVGDDWYAFWVMGAHDAVTISFTHHMVCNEVIKVLTPLIIRDTTIETQLDELGLL